MTHSEIEIESYRKFMEEFAKSASKEKYIRKPNEKCTFEIQVEPNEST